MGAALSSARSARRTAPKAPRRTAATTAKAPKAPRRTVNARAKTRQRPNVQRVAAVTNDARG